MGNYEQPELDEFLPNEDTIRRSKSGFQAPEVTNRARYLYVVMDCCDPDHFLETGERKRFPDELSHAKGVMKETDKQIRVLMEFVQAGRDNTSVNIQIAQLAWSYFKAKATVERYEEAESK